MLLIADHTFYFYLLDFSSSDVKPNEVMRVTCNLFYSIDRRGRSAEYLYLANAGVTQLVECNLAKVDVEGSNPFTRSKAASQQGKLKV